MRNDEKKVGGCQTDHRAFDGAYTAAALKRLKGELEKRDWSAELDEAIGAGSENGGP